MTKEQVDNGLSWLRKNLALIVAFFSLGFSCAGWYASYKVIIYRVEMNEQAMAAEQKLSREITDVLMTHRLNALVHTTAAMQQDQLNRLTRIENLLIEHMGAKK